MKNTFRLWSALLTSVRTDLDRTHRFAQERMGFFYCRAANLSEGVLVLVEGYSPIADEDYVNQRRVGAMMNSDALRKAMQKALSHRYGIFHVHMHDHRGIPHPSAIDMREARKFVPDFFNVVPDMPHGTIILSRDSLFGMCWRSKSQEPEPFNAYELVGVPLRIIDGK